MRYHGDGYALLGYVAELERRPAIGENPETTEDA